MLQASFTPYRARAEDKEGISYVQRRTVRIRTLGAVVLAKLFGSAPRAHKKQPPCAVKNCRSNKNLLYSSVTGYCVTKKLHRQVDSFNGIVQSSLDYFRLPCGPAILY